MSVKGDQKVAIKVLNKKKLRRKRIGRFGNALQNVSKEIAVWKLLDHPNVVPLYEVIDAKESGDIYLVSEFVDGGEAMPDELTADPLPWKRAQRIFGQLSRAVEYLHFQHVVHRDIKPGNILLSGENDHVMLTDFGVSGMFEEGPDELRSTDGTAAFLAPEMFSGDAFSGKLTDIWACGVTLYMMLFGRTPFTAATLPDLYEAIANDALAFPEDDDAFRDIPSEARDLLAGILEKDPAKRLSIDAIKAHPFVRGGGADEGIGKVQSVKIEVSADQIEKAVTPLTSFGQITSFVSISGKFKKKLREYRSSKVSEADVGKK